MCEMSAPRTLYRVVSTRAIPGGGFDELYRHRALWDSLERAVEMGEALAGREFVVENVVVRAPVIADG